MKGCDRKKRGATVTNWKDDRLTLGRRAALEQRLRWEGALHWDPCKTRLVWWPVAKPLLQFMEIWIECLQIWSHQVFVWPSISLRPTSAIYEAIYLRGGRPRALLSV